MKILVVLILGMPATAAQVCEGLKTFLSLRKSYTIPAPLSRMKSPDRLLSCVQNCTLLRSCRSYSYYTTEEKCILSDEQGNPIVTKENHEPATSRTTIGGRMLLENCGRVGFNFLPSSKTCVKVYREKKTWSDAMDFCRSESGTLVVIKSARKQEAARKLVRSLFGGVWIGAWDKTNTDTFEWCDGSPMNYTAWGPGEPSHTYKKLQENCVVMYYWANYRWNDYPCVSLLYFMCEIDPAKLVL